MHNAAARALMTESRAASGGGAPPLQYLLQVVGIMGGTPQGLYAGLHAERSCTQGHSEEVVVVWSGGSVGLARPIAKAKQSPTGLVPVTIEVFVRAWHWQKRGPGARGSARVACEQATILSVFVGAQFTKMG